MANRRKNPILIFYYGLLYSGIFLLLTACHKEQNSPQAPELIFTNTPEAITVSPINLGDTPVPTREAVQKVSQEIKPQINLLQTRLTKTPPAPTPVKSLPEPTPLSFPTLDGTLPRPPTLIPEPVPIFEKKESTINVLLVGNDVHWPQGGRTDALIIVSINTETGVVSLLSIPRDLYVVIPGWKMDRINLALPHGHGTHYPGGGGGLIKDTILYNLGVPVDFYIRIGFDGFIELIDSLGGIDVIVNCPITDWRLKATGLDETVEANWELFTLNYGLHHMDGDLALWFARSRQTSNDFDRGRRQQKILLGIWHKIEGDLSIDHAAQLFGIYSEKVETDLSFADLQKFWPLVSRRNQFEIRNFQLAGDAVTPWIVPVTGESVQLPNRGPSLDLVVNFMQPEALSVAERIPVKVIVVTSNQIIFEQAADNLRWYGFDPLFEESASPDPQHTKISYQGENLKGAFPDLLSWLFHQRKGDIDLISDLEKSTPQYRILLGQDFNPCLDYLRNINGLSGVDPQGNKQYSTLPAAPPE